MNKVVIVAYAFPPVGGAGVQRPAKFVKYLQEFGWQPLVLTVANPSVPVIDCSLLKDIPEDVVIYKSKTLEPSYTTKVKILKDKNGLKHKCKTILKSLIAGLLLPDMQILWWPGMINKLIGIIRYERPHCLFVTAPPFSSFLPIVFIGNLYKIPVVVDFRDEWSFSRNTWENATKNNVARFLDKICEKYVIKKCAAFTAANNSYIESICDTYGNNHRIKGFAITNGYDEDDFNYIFSDLLASDQSIVNIVYTGTVWKATSLAPFVTALRSVLDSHPFLTAKIKVKIFGRVVDEEKDYLCTYVTDGIIELFDYCEHDAIIREMSHADILLLTLSDLPGSEKIVTGKVFEYMASGRHILAIVPNGETRRIVSENYDNKTIVHPDKQGDICNSLYELILNISSVRKTRGKSVLQFSRRFLTAHLAEVFDFVTTLS
jgi:glycosyltransferase involved in cell wall biosynthesis